MTDRLVRRGIGNPPSAGSRPAGRWTRGREVGRCGALAWLALALAIGGAIHQARAVTISDGDFAAGNWQSFSFVMDDPWVPGPATNLATGSVARVATGGNPGAYTRVTQTFVYGDCIFTGAVKSDVAYDPSVSGAISTLSVTADVHSYGWTSSWQLYLAQGGASYFTGGVDSTNNSWTRIGGDDLTPADFDNSALGFETTPTGKQPDFSKNGGPIQFGFSSWGCPDYPGAPATGTFGIDNFSVTITSTAPPAVNAPTGCVVVANPAHLNAPGPVQLTASCSGGGAPTSYAWKEGATTLPLVGNPVTFQASKTTSITVVASNSGGSSTSPPVTIDVAALRRPVGCSVVPDPVGLAAAGNVVFTAHCTGGDPPKSYEWQVDSQSSTTTSNRIIAFVPGGAKTVWVTASNDGGSSSTVWTWVKTIPGGVTSLTFSDGEFPPGTLIHGDDAVLDDPGLPGQGPATSTAWVLGADEGGNPGAYLRGSVNVDYGDCAGAGAVFSDYVYRPSVNGAITGISPGLDVRATNPSIAGLFVEQAGRRYYTWGADFSYSAWHRLEGVVITAADFDTNPTAFHPNGTPDGNRPDFSVNGGPIRFGFWVAGCHPGAGGRVFTEFGLDNFSIAITSSGAPVNPPTGCTIVADPTKLNGPGDVLLAASCSGGGAPDSYEWKEGEDYYFGEKGSSLSLYLGVPGTFTFTVTASNAGGSNTSPPVTVEVTASKPPPSCSLVADPPSVKGAGIVVLTAFCTGGDEPERYRWTAGNAPLEEPGKSLTRYVTETTTFGVVAITAAGQESAKVTFVVKVIPIVPPYACRITATPATLATPGYVTLTASCAGGDPPTNFTWYQGFAHGLTTNPVIGWVGQTTYFAVQVGNDAGFSDDDIARVTVAVVVPPRPSSCALVASPNKLPAPGGKVMLTMTCSAGGKPTAYQWTTDFQTIWDSTVNQYSPPAISTTTSYLARARAADEWSDWFHTQVEVGAPPAQCTLSPSASAVAPGGQIVLRVQNCAGTGPFYYTFYGPNGVLPSGAQLSTNQYTLTNLVNGGLYQADVATAGGAKTTTPKARIYVTPGQCSLVSNPASPLPADPDGTPVTLTMTCNTGDMPEYYVWTRGESSIVASHGGATYSSTIKTVTEFTVEPRINEFGGERKSVRLEIYSPPPPLSCLSVTPNEVRFAPVNLPGGSSALAKASVASVKVTNACTQRLTIQNVSTAGGGAAAYAAAPSSTCKQGAFLDSLSSCRVDVNFLPKAVGVFQAALLVAGANGAEAIPLVGEGYAVARADMTPPEPTHQLGSLVLPSGRTFDRTRPTVVLTPDVDGDPAHGWTGFGDRQAGALLLQKYGNSVNILQYIWKDGIKPVSVLPRASYLAARMGARAAGEDLAWLLQADDKYGGVENVGQIHFIGHGLGAVVNAYAARRVLARVSPATQDSRFTILDFPANINQYRLLGFPVFSDEEAATYGYDSTFFSAMLGPIQEKAKLRIDNYHTRCMSFSGSGRPIEGAVYNHEGLVDAATLNALFPDEGVANDHDGIQQWYRWTIDPDLAVFRQRGEAIDGENGTWLPNGKFCQTHGAFTPPLYQSANWTINATLSPCGKGWSFSPISGGTQPSLNGAKAAQTSSALNFDNLLSLGGCSLQGTLSTATISCPPTTAAARKATTAVAFTAANWQGNSWCYNNNHGSWFPTVSADATSATFTDSLRDYCWDELRTVAYAEPQKTVTFELRPLLSSGGVNADEAYLGFGPTWTSCCARDIADDGWFSGIVLRNGKISTSRYLGYPNGYAEEQIGTYQSGTWITVRMTPVAGGVQVEIGNVSRLVPWYGQTDQTAKRFIAIESNSVDGMEMRSVTISSGAGEEPVAGAVGPLTVPPDARYFSMSVKFTHPIDGDTAVVSVGGETVWSVRAASFPDGVAVDTGPIPLAGLTGSRNFALGLYRAPGSAVGLEITDFKFIGAAVATNYGGLWWGSPAGSESGWGINFAHQGDVIFATWFTYDAAGKPWWLIAVLDKKATGNYSGDVFAVTGPPFNASPWDTASVVENPVGTMAVSFTTDDDGMLSFDVNGVSQTKAITRQVFGPLPFCLWGQQPNLAVADNFQDMWWGAPAGSESGWGINLTHQGDVIFATWFTYDAAGKPWWLVVEAHQTDRGFFTGPVSTVTGPAFGSEPFDPTQVVESEVGTATFQFADGNRATFAYTVKGAAGSKLITRQVFAPPGTVCQ